VKKQTIRNKTPAQANVIFDLL